MSSARVTALLVAAGGSRRMGFNKLLAPLAGTPVLRRTLAAFEACAAIDDLLVIAGDEVATAIATWQSESPLSKLRRVLPGGAERHFSVWAGLQTLTSGLVAVHDGARPLITPEQITRCLDTARETGAAVCARPLTETVKRVDASGRVSEPLDRAGVWIMETPQVFAVDLLQRAYTAVLADGLLVTDEVSAVQHLGEPVRVVENTVPNPKITFPADLELAERLLLTTPPSCAPPPRHSGS